MGGAEGRDGAVTLQDCARVSGPFFHGTRAVLRPGDELVPGRVSNFDAGRVMNHVYFTSLLDTAAWGAELAVALAGEGPVVGGPGGAGTGGERGHVYEVEPRGPFEDDPNVTDKRFPGNVTRSYRSRHPLRVVREVPDSPGHDAETLQRMVDGLRVLRSKGLDVIED